MKNITYLILTLLIALSSSCGDKDEIRDLSFAEKDIQIILSKSASVYPIKGTGNGGYTVTSEDEDVVVASIEKDGDGTNYVKLVAVGKGATKISIVDKEQKKVDLDVSVVDEYIVLEVTDVTTTITTTDKAVDKEIGEDLENIMLLKKGYLLFFVKDEAHTFFTVTKEDYLKTTNPKINQGSYFFELDKSVEYVTFDIYKANYDAVIRYKIGGEHNALQAIYKVFMPEWVKSTNKATESKPMYMTGTASRTEMYQLRYKWHKGHSVAISNVAISWQADYLGSSLRLPNF